MVVEGLTMPPLLDDLLSTGRWPRNVQELGGKYVSVDCRRKLRQIQLNPPPFRTLARFAAAGWDDFYGQFGAIHELVPECSVCIADFGLGADSPILLDFQIDRANPRVIYLHWPGKGEPNCWVELAPDFDGFVGMLGL